MTRPTLVVLLALLAPGKLWAGSYFQQATFNVPVSTLAGMDADAVGNLYLLGMAQGATTYQVTGETTQGITPLFTFDTGLSSPSAFAVEGSGVIDILDSKDGYRLLRFTNPGTFVGQASYSLALSQPPKMVATAIDKVNGRLYIAYQAAFQSFHLECIGCPSPPPVTQTLVNQYDFQGNFLHIFGMPGADSSPGSCYTPTAMTVDPQGNIYIADALCQQLLKFSASGTLTSSTPASQWSAPFAPRGMWTDPASNVYISEPVCVPSGCPQGVVKLGPDGAFQTSFAANSAVGCAWDQRNLYLSSSGSQPLRRFIYDGAPSVSAESGPFGMVIQHSSAAALAWQAATDPDGDPVTYMAYLGTNPTQLSAVGSTSQPGFTTQPLTFGVTYYWQVVAQDSYLNLPLQQTSAPVVAFNLNLINSAPNGFAAVNGTGTAVTRTPSVTLAWQAAVDPDGDPVVYDLFWSTSTNLDPSTGTTSATSWSMTALSFGSTYYWSVRARDSYGAATWLSGGLPQAYHLVFQDAPPSSPVYLSTSPSYSQHTASPSVSLSWQPSLDPDGDPISYRLDVQTTTGAWPSMALGSATGVTLSTVLETTYTWRVAASDPYGGVSTGPWTSFIPHLANQSPYPIVYTAPNSLATRTSAYVLTWQDTGDPDGDPYSYSAFVSTNPSAQGLVQQGTATAYNLRFQFGTTYYWSLSATDSFGATTKGALQTFLPTFKNTPPPAPDILAGSGSMGQHTLTPAAPLAWSSVTDPDGDPVAYRLNVGTNSSALALVQDGASLSYAVPGLQFGATYYWRVAAYDPYGGASTSPLQSLYVFLQNTPPQAFPILSGTGVLSTRDTSTMLSWGNAVDPDGDTVTYSLAVSTKPGALPVVQSSTGTSFALSFQFGATYYWQVTALDGFGGMTQSGVQSLLPVFKNSAPPGPVIFSGAGQFGQHALSPQATLAWSSVTDSDGDPVDYRLFLSTNPAALTKVQDGSGTSYPLPSPQFGTTYYWQVAAYDPYGGASTTTVQSLLLFLQNSPPSSFPILTGTGTLATRNTTQVLSWQNAFDSDGDMLTYDFALSTNPATAPLVQSSTATSYSLSCQLGTTYYWQVTARDGFGGKTSSVLQTFLPVFRNSPPSGPVNQSKMGTFLYHGFVPSQSFFWQASTDPDGDPFSYSLYYGTDATHMAVVSSAPMGFTLSNLPLNQAFNYQIVATDIYGAASPSPANWVYYQFANNPPGSFDVVGPIGSVSTRQTSATLSWTSSVDPDGDSVTYGVFTGTSPSALSPLAGTTKTSALLSNMAYGTTYYWRVDAYDGFGGTATVSEGVQSLVYLFYDPQPSPVVYLSAAASYAEHTSSPSVVLSWAASANAAGDPIVYRLDIQTSTGAWPSIPMGPATSISLPVLFETTYTWRVTASDPYGGASTGSWMSFITHLANQPPSPIVYSSPSSLVTRAVSTVLSWQDTADPDGDPYGYSFYLSTNPAGQYLIQQGTQTGYSLNFQFGTTYYWRVSAADSFGATTNGSLQTFLPVFKNAPPPSPAITAGAGQFGEHTLSPQGTLAWSSVFDQDGDQVAYRLFLSTNPAALTKVQDGSGTSYQLPSPQFGTTYYWQVAAYDPYGGASTTTMQSLSLYLQNSPPASFPILTGTGTLATRSTSLLLSWQNATDPDGDTVTYDLALSTNPAALPVIQSSTTTSYTLSCRLGTTYYWQVTARDGFGGTKPSGPQAFFPFFRNSPPTVPVNQSKTGTLLYHGFAPSESFFWLASSDPDGDPFTYSLSYGTDTDRMSAMSPVPLGFTIPNIPLNTGFYYSIAATDIYGAASNSPVSWVYYQFTNTPPAPFDVVGPIGTVSTRQTSANLSWTSSADADGDSISYGVFTGTAPSALALLTNTTKTSAVLPNMAFGTTYYWRVDAYDGFGGTTTATEGVQNLVYLFYDPPPSPVVYVSSAGAYNLHTSSPSVPLGWWPSANAAGDPISYRVDIQTSTGAWPSIPMGPATSISLPVLFETTYTWRVTAYDPYGGASAGAWMSVIAHLSNQSPTPIVYTSLGSLVTRAESFALSWQDTGDPDGDPTSYGLFLSTNAAAQSLVRQGTQTAYSLNFQFGTTYYWRVSATDSFGATNIGALQAFLPTFKNSPPPFPTILSGTGQSGQHTLSPQATLAWSSVTDPDTDPVAYRLFLATTPAALGKVQDGPGTSFPLASPQFGTTYYWQVAAYDAYGGASTTVVQGLVLFLQNSPPAAFPILSGAGTLATRNTSQLLSWQNAFDPEGDSVAYDLTLSTNPAVLPVVQSSTATSYNLSCLLGTTYFWQVTARDGFGGKTPSPLQTFLPVFRNSAPSVPLNLSKTGTLPYHGFSPSEPIFWQASTDPDGDPFSYSLYYGTDSSHMAVISPVPLGFTLSDLPLNQAINYQIVATDIYGAASNSPLNWVYFQFANIPPGPFDVAGPIGTVSTRQTSANLTWTPSIDPDGDSVSYGVFTGTTPAALALLSNTTKTSAVLSNMAFGTTYYWRVEAYDGFGGTKTVTEGLQSLLYLFYDPPPSPIVYVSSSSSYSLHTGSPSVPLSWWPSANAAGDPISYRLEVQTSTGAWPPISMGPATSISLPVQFEIPYTWRVTAFDPYGGASTGAWMSFITHLANRPPNPIVYSTPAALVTRETSVGLTWQDTGDPEGDPYNYLFYLSIDSAVLPNLQTSTTTSFNLSFQFGTTYYWRVSAVDSFGARTDGALQAFLPVFRNSPPPSPGLLSGVGAFGQHTLSPQAALVWSPVLDPDADLATYRLFLSTNPAALRMVQDGPGTSYPLPSPQFGTTYYWQVAAYDPYGGASTTAVQSLLLTLQNSPPASFPILAGAGTLATRNTSQLLSWQNAVDPDGDPLTYDLTLSTNPAALAIVQSSAATAYNLSFQLGTTYYWQVTARDGLGGATSSPLQTFVPVFRNSPPSVPVNQSKTGTILYHGFSPSQSFFWQASNDPDGDSFSYNLYYGTDSGHMAVVTSAPLGFTLPNLPLNQAVNYQTVATDIYGAASSSPVNWVYYQFVNNPPGPFDVVGTVGTVSTRQTSANLTWTSSVDPDGDSVSYGVFTGTSPAALSPLAGTTKTSAALSNMAYGTTYYWRVDAYDGFGGTTTVTEGLQSLLYRFYDPLPAPIVYISSASSYSLHSSSPSVPLSWWPSANAAGDPISYQVDIQTSTGAWPSIPMGGATSINVPVLFETTYTWRVTAYDPYGGASTGAWMGFIGHLANRPPNPTVYSTPSSLVTRAGNTALTWQDTGDADGDPYSYSFYLSTDPAALLNLQSSTATSYNLAFQFGATYYWRVSAVDSFGARTEGALQAFLPVFRNSPPPSPAIFSGAGQFGQHTLSPQSTLAWSSVFDPDGDLVAYRLFLSTNPTALSKVQDGSGTSFSLTSPQFGTTYYWQVAAYDSYGGTGTTAVQSLSLTLQNSPPSSFSIISGAGTLATRTTSQLLSWQNAVDPDGDMVTYDLTISTNLGAAPVVQSSTVTNYSFSFQLGTTYYWQVTARDGFGGSTPSGLQAFLPVFRNSPPSVPANQSRTGTILYHGFSPTQTFFWQAATDPDGDPFSYNLHYGTDSNRMAAISSAPLGYTLSNLPLNQAIYYQTEATDIYGAASPSPVSWVYYQFANNPPGTFDVVGTTGTGYTRQTSANLSWTASADPEGDSVTYGVFVGTTPAALSPLTNTTKTSAVLSDMAFGTTYYWRVDAYDGFGGSTTMSTGVQSLLSLFYDPKPSPVVYLSTAASYGVHTSSPIVVLSWAASSNAAGDPISYRLEIQTSTGPWPSVAMGPATNIALAPIFGTTYTWRVTAYDPYGGASTGAWMSFITHLANRPPNPILYSSPSSTITRSNSYPLAWLDSGDADGDPYSYSFYLSTDPAAQNLIQQGTQTAYALTFQFGATYYWRLSATDSFGARTDGALQTFLPVFRLSPPPAPTVFQSTGTLPEHALSARVPLSWSVVQDPDGDPINYQLLVGLSTSSMATVQSSTQTSFLIADAVFGATYFWQVSAQNPFGGAGTTAVQSATPVLADNPPGAFAVASGTGTLMTRSTTQVLAWTPSVDPDGDMVVYALSLSTDPGRPAVVQTSTATRFTLAFAFGTTYYWSVSAFDGFGGTATLAGGAQSFYPVFLNNPPQAPNIVAPFSVSPVVKTMNNSVTASWNQVSDPEGDPITYTIYLGNSPGNMTALATVGQSMLNGAATLALRPVAVRPQSQVQLDGNIITLSLSDLDYYKTYYFRVAASNPYGSTTMTPVTTFALVSIDGFPKAYNYPNPFSPNRGGTNIVFNAPPSGYAQATVEVYSEWQALLFKQDYFNIPPGITQVHFDGRDRYGRAFFNGSYTCRVRFSGPDDKQVFYMLVVK